MRLITWKKCRLLCPQGRFWFTTTLCRLRGLAVVGFGFGMCRPTRRNMSSAIAGGLLNWASTTGLIPSVDQLRGAWRGRGRIYHGDTEDTEKAMRRWNGRNVRRTGGAAHSHCQQRPEPDAQARLVPNSLARAAGFDREFKSLLTRRVAIRRM